MLELIPCASSAVGGGHDESIYDTFMSYLPAVLSAFTQAVNMPSEMVAQVYDQKRLSAQHWRNSSIFLTTLEFAPNSLK